MITLEDAAQLALAMPEAQETERRGLRTWTVNGKTFAWERPLTKADIKRFGSETPPDGPIVAVRVEDLGEKEAVLAANHPGFFTMTHFDGFPAVLIQLDKVGKKALRDAIVDGWLALAPARLVAEYLEGERKRKR
jgi:hypothetical protein